MWTLEYLITYNIGQIRYHPFWEGCGEREGSENRKRALLSWAPHTHTQARNPLSPVTFSKLLLTDATRLQTSGSCLKHHIHWNGTCIWALLGHPEPVGSAECSRTLGLCTSSKIYLPEPYLSLKLLSQCPQAPLCSTGLLSSLPSQGNLYCFQWLFLLFFIPSSKDCWSLEMLVAFILQESANISSAPHTPFSILTIVTLPISALLHCWQM